MARIYLVPICKQHYKMIQLFKHRWNRMAVRLAITSFVIGTIFMLVALTTDHEILITFGITFLVLYIPVTGITLFVLLTNTIMHFKDIQEHIMTFIVVLMNIPIALLYINFLTS